MDDARALAGVRVKPLVWEERWTGEDDDIPVWRARNPLALHVGFSFAGHQVNGKPVERHDDAPAAEVEAAKAAAQADYEARILSALDRLAAPEGVGLTLETTATDRMWAAQHAPELLRDIDKLTTSVADLEARLAEAGERGMKQYAAYAAEVDRADRAERALADATKRIEALERASWTVTGWREKDRPSWFCRVTAQLIADQYREARALLSPASEGKT